MKDHSTQGPRVFVPPPLIFLGGWLAAWLASRAMPFEIDGAGASIVQIAVGALLIAGGLGLMGWALVTFLTQRTPVIPVRPARVVVTGGPYRFTRNPMYLGLTAAYLGLAALVNDAWPLVFLPIVLLVLSSAVIAREEQHLRSTFGETYEAYSSRVHRWL